MRCMKDKISQLSRAVNRRASPERAIKPEVLKFAIVGSIGFCVDAGVMTYLLSNNFEILYARTFSFFLAASATWILNRVWTFEAAAKTGARKEYLTYFAYQILGALINLIIFFALLHFINSLRQIPAVPLAVGAAASMIFNYFSSKYFVFRGGK